MTMAAAIEDRTADAHTWSKAGRIAGIDIGLDMMFVLVLLWGFSIALRSQHHFGRLVALGVTSMMFLYVFINTAMVMGVLPVVGVPLPLIDLAALPAASSERISR